MPMRLELPDQVEDQAHHQLDLLNSYTDVIDMPKCIIGHKDTLNMALASYTKLASFLGSDCRPSNLCAKNLSRSCGICDHKSV